MFHLNKHDDHLRAETNRETIATKAKESGVTISCGFGGGEQLLQSVAAAVLDGDAAQSFNAFEVSMRTFVNPFGPGSSLLRKPSLGKRFVQGEELCAVGLWAAVRSEANLLMISPRA